MANIGLGTLFVKIGANTSGIKKGLAETNTALRKTDKNLKTNAKEWQNWSAKSAAANAALAVSIGLTAQKAFEYSDAFTSMTNKLKLVTDGTEDLADVTDKMFDVANRTRTSVEATTSLYTKMFRATKDLDIGQGRLLKVTESINKAFAIGGATTAETTGAIRQLGQALASGTLRGDEFNSIAEQAPIIMEAVKEATGETAGSLRELAATGAISAEILIESLERYANKIDTDYAQATATFGQKLEVARNIAIKFVSTNDDVTDAVGATGDVVLALAENLDVLIGVGQTAAVIYGAVLVGSMTNYTRSVVANSIATTNAVVKTNLWTGATTRLSFAAVAASRTVGVLSKAMALLGGPVGIAISVIAALALFVDWESKSEKQTRETTKKINDQIAALKGLSEAQLDVKNAEFIAAQDELNKKIKQQKEVVNAANEAKKKDPYTIGNVTALARAQEELNALIAERLKLQEVGNKIFDIKLEGKISGGESDEQIDLKAKETAEKLAKINAKIVAKLSERLKSETQLENEKFERENKAIEAQFSAKIAAAEKAGKDTAALQVEQNDLEAALTEEHLANLAQIKKEAEEKTSEQKATEKFLQELTDRFKSQEQLENERYAADRERFIAAKGGEAALTAENHALLEQMRLEHLERLKELEDPEGRIESIRERFASDAELEQERFANEILALQEHLAAKKVITDEDRALMLQLGLEHAKNMTDIKDKEERAKLAITTSAIDAASSALMTGGKKAQAIGKKLAIVNAIIKGKEAAVAAWSAGMATGGPWAPVVAAAYTANSIAQTASMISSIKSAGSGSSSGSRPSAGSVGAISGPSGASPTGAGSAPQAQQNVTIDMQGTALLNAEMFRTIIGGINDQLGDGVNLNVTGG